MSKRLMDFFEKKASGLIMLTGILLFFSFSGCGLFRNGKSKPAAKKEAEINNLSVKLAENSFHSNYFSCRAKTDYRKAGEHQNLTLNLKMKKDSIIWVSVTAIMGLEAARILITPDSIKVMDRINKEYLARDFNFLTRYTNCKLTISQLQNILLGNHLFPAENYFLLKNESGLVNATAEINKVENFLEISGDNYRVKSSLLTNLVTMQKMKVDYDEFSEVEKKMVPNKLEINVKSNNEEMKISMNYSNISTSEIESFPFSVPASYERD